MRETRTPSPEQRLRAAVERTGYYPVLVLETLDLALAGESVRASLVHHEAHFDGDELRRHVTVLAITHTRLVLVHTDEYPPDEGHPAPYALTSTEAVPLARVGSVVLTRAVDAPTEHQPGDPAAEATLAIGWGAVSRVELDVATCGDPACDADHGYTGTLSADDYSMRVSAAGDGASAVRDTLEFARALSAATAGLLP